MEIVKKYGANSATPYRKRDVEPSPEVEDTFDEGTNEVLSYLSDLMTQFATTMAAIEPVQPVEPLSVKSPAKAPKDKENATEDLERPKWRAKKSKPKYGLSELELEDEK
jgi:hypothetical protein